MKPGTITLAGAGPGAPDLLTVRAHRAIVEADVIVYAGSLVSPEILQHAQRDCVIHDSASLDLQQILDIMIEAARSGKRVLRLHTGDPSVYGATAEQMRGLDKAGIPYETIPGVSAAFAAAAALNVELTQPGISQSVTITRRAGRTPVPEREDLSSFAAHGASLALYLSISDMPGVVEELLAPGAFRPETPAAVVYRASWPDQLIVRGTLADIAQKVQAAGIRRQAIILVGDALLGQGDDSLLYHRQFAHGYRNRTDRPVSLSQGPAEPFLRFAGRIAVYGLTEAGCQTARAVASLLNGTAFTSAKHFQDAHHEEAFDPGKLSALIARNWQRFDAHVFVMASGIVVRKIASLLESKDSDPAVVVLDEAQKFAQSLVSGHLGGANRLCQDIAQLTAAQAVLSTGSDVQGLTAFDEIAATRGWRIENIDTLKTLNSALLEHKTIGLFGFTTEEAEVYSEAPNLLRLEDPTDVPTTEAIVTLDADPPANFAGPCLRLTRLPLVVGVGCRKGVPREMIASAIRETCERYSLDESRIEHLASVDQKKDEPGILAIAAERGWESHFLPSSELEKQSPPNPSSFVAQTVSTPSVAEAACLAIGKGRLLVPKQKLGPVTVALGTMGPLTLRQGLHPADEQTRGKIIAIGIGPGTRAGMTHEAEAAIRNADCVVGYRSYCRQIEWLTGGENVFATGMRSEIERCDEAVRRAAEGKVVALICSGDAGVYGMAGLALERVEVLDQIDSVAVEVIPGVTSSCSAAAVVGAPLINDFATVSLSDLLTPREVIQKRIDAVVASGMVCALYNPRSRKRQALLDEVLAKFSEARGPETPAALVRDAGRPQQWSWVGQLQDIPVAEINMTTMVLIGNEQSRIVNGRFYTRRGYEKKGTY
ncbi:MAG: precorrin-4 C(11)-methyltransferase [Puniceicoccales bacterium]